MTTVTNDMFAQIKSALTKEPEQNNRYRDILKCEVGNVYTVRILPNLEDPKDTFFHYYTHAWESFSTGQFMSHVSPQTWGDKDPIAETRYTLYKHGTEEEKAKASKVIRRENWLANIYVINDPKNPDNNGKVKLLRFGKQLHKIITEAIDGEDADEFGARIFDLSENGCSLKIKVERQGDYPTYVSSRFSSPTKIKGMDDDRTEEILGSKIALDTVFPVKTYDELKKVLDEHFHCKVPTVDDGWKPEETTSTQEDKPDTTKSGDDPLDDDKVKELLEGLGD
jgi:hypothetical protein